MDENLLLPRANDLITLTKNTDKPHFLGFLSEEEAAICLNALKKYSKNILVFGGYEAAERKFLAAIPDWCSNPQFPIKAITIKYNSAYKLTHRDFLGSLMALQIKREAVGDILIDEGRAVVFLREEILDFVSDNLKKIGRVGVRIEQGIKGSLPNKDTFKSFSDTVSSMRLDCVVTSICSVSRNKAIELINSQKVLVNSLSTLKATKTVSDNDTISVRGYGKFYITSSNETTKKARIILKYNKYV